LRKPEQKVAIFSVWDPTAGDDPNAVATEDRVEVLHADPEARIKRFGGEGTGGQCQIDFPWRVGETNRFVVRAKVEGEKTAYAGYLYWTERKAWRHLVTFRTRTRGQPLKGYYSFIEDFRRDGQSVHDVRRARFGNGWVKAPGGDWVSLTRARFTASNAEWESKENIDAGLADLGFYLATGGDTKSSRALRSVIERPPAGAVLPDFVEPRDPQPPR
jgi:hypothetical protein